MISNSALLYVRVSSKEQEKEGFSLDAQEKLGLDYAKRKGFEIVKTWKVSESAWREERISFNQMVEYAKKHSEIQHIIFDVTDRMTRNDFDKIKIFDLIISLKAQMEEFTQENQNYLEDAESTLELCKQLKSLYDAGSLEEKAGLAKIAASNYSLTDGTLYPQTRKPFDLAAKGLSSSEWLALRGQEQAFDLVAQQFLKNGYDVNGDKKITLEDVGILTNAMKLAQKDFGRLGSVP